MSEIARLPTDRARFEPEAVFAHPRDLIDDIMLTRGQKLAALARWRQHLLEKMRATQEGMNPPPGRTAAEAEMLTEIDQVEKTLQESAPDPTS